MNKKKCIVVGVGVIAAISSGIAIAKIIKTHNKTLKTAKNEPLETRSKECPYSSPISCDFCDECQSCETPHIRNSEIVDSFESMRKQPNTLE